MNDRSRKYWLNTVSRDHLMRGKEGGFVQANHGKRAPLERLSPGDLMVFYSPQEVYGEKTPCQRFTALAEITGEAPYRVEMSPAFQPFRREARFLPIREAPIQPLLSDLTFIPDKIHWGLPFRRGLFEIGAEDFALIVAALEPEG